MNPMQCTVLGCPRDVTLCTPRYCEKHAEERTQYLREFYRDKINLSDERALEIAELAVAS